MLPAHPAALLVAVDESAGMLDRVALAGAWLRDAGFRARIAWRRDDLALRVADRP